MAIPGVEQREEVLQEPKLEPRFRVLVHNDDFTPFDFVILVIIRFFMLNPSEAQTVAWTAHHSGVAQVAILPKAEAQIRVGKAHFAASVEGYPLTFTIEPLEE